MHQIKQVIAVLFISVSLFSCAKTEKVLVKHDGEWNIDKQVTTTTTGGVSTTETDTDYGVATFNENGTLVLSPTMMALPTLSVGQ
ncbi:MAG: hypothetical protein IPI31_03305 [Bacteroidetes bacterium]|nr:hypothetical protein [Bacteroidota bacterium]